jgi:predicted protein tyrosine phosphatase
VFSREEMIKWYKNNPTDTTPVISINDIGYGSPVPEGHPLCLKLYFDDITHFHYDRDVVHPAYTRAFRHRDPVFFTEKDANAVIDFLTEAFDATRDVVIHPSLFVHCYQGISRSISVATYAELYSRFGDDSFFLSEKFLESACNSEVLKILLTTRIKRGYYEI